MTGVQTCALPILAERHRCILCRLTDWQIPPVRAHISEEIMGRKHWRRHFLYRFFICVRTLFPVPICPAMGRSGTGGCHLRNLGRFDGIINETPTGHQGFRTYPARTRRNARPLRQRLDGNSRRSSLSLCSDTALKRKSRGNSHSPGLQTKHFTLLQLHL